MSITFSSNVNADTWSFPIEAVETVYEFGETRIVKTVDGRENNEFPDFIIDIYKSDKLQAKYRGISFKHIAASKNNDLFVGISNEGIPGTSLVIFDSKGNLRIEAKHFYLPLHYCEQSITLVRKWYDDKNPNLHFIYEESGKVKDMVVNGCDGEEIKIIDHIVSVYEGSKSKEIDSK